MSAGTLIKTKMDSSEETDQIVFIILFPLC